MQTTTIAGFVQGLDRSRHAPLLRRAMARLRAMRMAADMAVIEPRLREDAGLPPQPAEPIRVAVEPLWSR
jgi:hypothetical protein